MFGWRQVPWSLEDWAQEDERVRRAHADATLAHSAALVAGPLLTSPDLRVGLLPCHTQVVFEVPYNTARAITLLHAVS